MAKARISHLAVLQKIEEMYEVKHRNMVSCNVSRGKLDSSSTWQRAERRGTIAALYSPEANQPRYYVKIGRRRQLIDIMCLCHRLPFANPVRPRFRDINVWLYFSIRLVTFFSRVDRNNPVSIIVPVFQADIRITCQ